MKILKAVVFFIFFVLVLKVRSQNFPSNGICHHDSIRNEIEQNLRSDFNLWYPLCVDTVYGGFFSDIDFKWNVTGRQNKMIVSQARHVWSLSKAAEFNPDGDRYLKLASHGFDFLRNIMWDAGSGGFFELVSREGIPIQEGGGIIKTAYGNSFAVYALAAYFSSSGDSAALNLAIEAFRWLDEKSYDKNFGGYFQFLSGDGVPFRKGFRDIPPKDQNSSIHLLECFTELFKVWKDERLRTRLESLLVLIRDRITTEKGYMNLFFTEEMVPVSYRDSAESVRKDKYNIDHVSFGHDIETAYLLLEASEVLNPENDTLTLFTAKKMADHSLKFGWDRKSGGIYDRGYYYNEDASRPEIIQDTKEWWAQAEALNTLLIMALKFPDDTSDYTVKFCKQWNYIKNYLIDKEYGGWFWGGIDIEPDNRFSAKGTIWKVNYHTTRALLNCVKLLKSQRDFIR